MAVTGVLYNHTRKLFANGEVNLGDIKVMLVNGYSFDATHTNISSVSGSEVSGNGWASGGEALVGAAVTTVSTNLAMFDGDDISEEATVGNIGPATGLVIYQDTTSEEFPLIYMDFGGAETAAMGTNFQLVWNALGIMRWLAP